MGHLLDERQTFRFGIIKAKFGFGYDYKMSDRTTFNFDLFDINQPTMDFRTRYKITDRVDFIIGVDDIFKDNQEIKLGTGLKF
jgi:hypothetical protein